MVHRKGWDRNTNNTVAANREAHERKMFVRYWRRQGKSYQEIGDMWLGEQRKEYYEELGRKALAELNISEKIKENTQLSSSPLTIEELEEIGRAELQRLKDEGENYRSRM